ncbi:MAG: GNAT family N-acetyltransferase [Micropepsaceae bacterium]
MIIRDATDDDLPAIVAIFNYTVRDTTAVFSSVETDVAARADWAAGRRAKGFPVLVAEAEGQVIGFASYDQFRSFPGYRHTVEHSVYVDPASQRRGAGRALMEALVADARARRLHVMVGGIDADNAGSIALHAALGFTETGRMAEVGVKFGRWLTLVFMQLVLHPGAAPPEAR